MFRLVAVVSLFLSLFWSFAHAQNCASGDLNRDGYVNIADFLIFVDQFGGNLPPCPPDTVVVTVRDTVEVQSSTPRVWYFDGSDSLSVRNTYFWHLLSARSTDFWYDYEGAEPHAQFVIFGNFECPAVGDIYRKLMAQARGDHGNEFRADVVYRHVPTSRYPSADKGATIARCIRDVSDDNTDVFKYFDLVFAPGASLNEGAYAYYASQLGLPSSSFQACLNDANANRSYLDDAYFESLAIGLTDVPSIFIMTDGWVSSLLSVSACKLRN